MPTATTAENQRKLQTVLVTKSGKPKSYYSFAEKLEILDPKGPRETTINRLVAFRSLFAFRFTKASITRVGQPRAWSALRGQLSDEDIVRHLLADRIPTQLPQWVGARSFPWSYWLCIDVDADRTKENILADEYEVDRMDAETKQYFLNRQKPPASKPSFESRCQLVEQAFARMGIDSRKRNEVLVQRTPSGGRHYYLFFDKAYFIDQYRQLLFDAGLYHKPGEIEFFPSTQQALRLPFGHIPGQKDRPNAWIEFIDRYRFGRIKRHSLEKLNERLFESNYVPKTVNSHPQTPKTEIRRPTILMGTPKSARKSDRKSVTQTEVDQSEVIATNAICSIQDAEELMSAGIQTLGTRNHILKQLAAHLIWFRHQSADEAATILTAWALDPRHNSQDIAYDLANGTDRVAKQIVNMCEWYEKYNKNQKRSSNGKVNAQSGKFTGSEIKTLKDYLAPVPEQERLEKAEFTLHFLNFAKRHGNITECNKSWQSSPAVRQVIRRWPGCHHMNYKPKIEWAVEIGLLEMTKGKWQRPNGVGRARTYRINVAPDTNQTEHIDYETALKILANNDPFGPPKNRTSKSSEPETPINTGEPDVTHQNDSSPSASTRHDTSELATTLRAAGSSRHLEARAHQRHQKRDAIANLFGQYHGAINSASRKIKQLRCHSSNPRSDFGNPSDMIVIERKRLNFRQYEPP